MPSNPVFLLVPGAWHGPDAFDEVSHIVNRAGFSTVPINIPSVGGDSSVIGFDHDVACIRSALQSLAEAGNDVIVVMHSYGSCPASEAMKGLAKAERENRGQRGGVIGLVFVCAFVLLVGESLFEKTGGMPQPWYTIDGDCLRVTTPKATFFNDLDDEEAQLWIAKMTHQTFSSFKSKITYAAWQQIPSTYLICEDDNAIPVHFQETMISTAGSELFRCERLKASHFPMLSQPDAVASCLIRAAGAII